MPPHLRAAARSGDVAAGFRDAVARIAYDSASVKINVALERLPSFTACPGTNAGPQHRGTMHFCPDQDFIERAYDDAKYGAPSREPVVECAMPVVARSDRRAARQAPDVDVRAVRAVQAERRPVDRGDQGRVRRPLL